MPQLDALLILFCSERSDSNMIAKIFDANPQVSAPELYCAIVHHWTFGAWAEKREVNGNS